MEYDVVDKAEKVMQELQANGRFDKYKNQKVPYLTKSQIRKFLSAVNTVKNKVDVEKVYATNVNVLSDEMAAEVKFLKVSILYQAGRERAVKDFVEKAEITKIIVDIGKDANKFNKFCKYIEALVAFHKYYGGEEK